MRDLDDSAIDASPAVSCWAANHFEAVMLQDFDFKIGRGHYRGHGIRALVTLAIVHLPRVAYVRGRFVRPLLDPT
jgi:hypothetical protein